MYGSVIKRESRLYTSAKALLLRRHALRRLNDHKWLNDNSFISFLHEYIEYKHSNRKYIENEAMVSAVDFRVLSAESCMGKVYLENSSDLRFLSSLSACQVYLSLCVFQCGT